MEFLVLNQKVNPNRCNLKWEAKLSRYDSADEDHIHTCNNKLNHVSQHRCNCGKTKRQDNRVRTSKIFSRSKDVFK